MSQSTSHRAKVSKSTRGAEVDRRRFIDLCSKYAVAAPAIGLLISATKARADGRSGCSGGSGGPPGCSLFAGSGRS